MKMDCYVTKNSNEVFKISTHNYEKDPGHILLYYQDNSYYALCPSCDNPIQICSLYDRKSNSPKAHGRHTGKDIAGLGKFSVERYDNCPYASHKSSNNTSQMKENIDEETIMALTLLQSNFDRVIYLLQKTTGLRISNALSEKMLASFMGIHGNKNENLGYLYRYFNKVNFPFLFAYRSQEFSIRGQFITFDSELHKNLQNKGIKFSEKGQIEFSHEINPNLHTFSFIKYKTEPIDTVKRETVMFCVFDKNRQIIYEKKIILDLEYINNLMRMKFNNNQALLSIAKKIISDNYLQRI